MININEERLINRIKTLGDTGRDAENRVMRVAATDEDKLGRDLVKSWMQEAGLRIEIDRIGNVFGIWETEENKNEEPVFIGSHIDSVINAGIYDGCYGILSGLEVVETLKENNVETKRPIVASFYTNEEGVRYQPDMMGSLVYAGGMDVDEVLKTVGTDGTILGEELERIGYAGNKEPGFLKPHSYVELHVEQGSILHKEGIPVGAVENLQGISWQKITIKGVANHAGTTPMYLRHDAGYVASEIIKFVHDMCEKIPNSVGTIGMIKFLPNAINVIPSLCEFTVDLRNPDNDKLIELEEKFDAFLKEICEREEVEFEKERLVRFDPVKFDEHIVKLIEDEAKSRNIKIKRMTSGAGHDAQMMARICDVAMIFVPSIDGISHNPKELTEDKDLVQGANILLGVIEKLANE
ncbi:Zn-dependent hydrolase [Peptoniphilus ovalis]|uniref:Zn-dependent hydrolase n=1 Tax=Peptoniphilus ovalis TaxID=2841503 RepID=UPI001FE89A8B|nr:Zn-dependent hydrolase [Peptoniphilus ovalis]